MSLKPLLGISGIWDRKRIFRYGMLDEDGTGNNFETDQAKTDTPTLTLASFLDPAIISRGKINNYKYRLNPTNAVTFVARLWEGAYAANYASNFRMLYETPAAQVDDEDYDRAEMDIPFILDSSGNMYYSIDWSGAPGNTPGYMRISGEEVF